jgi:hypothetical protein
MRAEYRAAFIDWAACASRGGSEPAARAAAAAGATGALRCAMPGR